MAGQSTVYGIQSTAGAVSIRNKKGKNFPKKPKLKNSNKKIFQVSSLCKK